MKLREAQRDLYRRLAKERGFRSRASYKLLQINSKYGIIRRGGLVIDFGSAPGGWLEVASKAVSSRGKVVGVDLVGIEPVAENVETIVADVHEPMIEMRILELLGGRVDVVLSDLSPKITGIWEMDHSLQIDMTLRVVSLLPEILKGRRDSLLKAFDGPRIKSLESELKEEFGIVRIVKPPASRGASSEVYMLCQNYLH